MATISSSIVLLKNVTTTVQAAVTAGKTVVAVTSVGHGKALVVFSV